MKRIEVLEKLNIEELDSLTTRIKTTKGSRNWTPPVKRKTQKRKGELREKERLNAYMKSARKPMLPPPKIEDEKGLLLYKCKNAPVPAVARRPHIDGHS